MGACSTKDKKRVKKNNTGKDENPDDGNKEQNGEQDDIILLRSGKNNINFRNKQYTINVENLSTQITIVGNKVLKQILTDNFNFKENADFKIEFENNKIIGNDSIDIELGSIIQEIFGNDIPEIINIKFSYTGLDLPENCIQSYKENNQIIGSAIIDNVETIGIVAYEVNTKLISSYSYKISDYPILNNINCFTAYCNTKGFLYFSGGENEQTNDLDITTIKYNDFFAIDLTQLTRDKLNITELPNLNEPRTWHSMIYVPNKYIFIVGGSNTKSVELYDMEEKKITKDSELNELRCECTLCLVNNMYLYAFFGFILHQEYNNSIERCNLLKEDRKWEYVQYELKEGLNLKLSFFGISYSKENELLLIGGNDNDNEQRYDYIYTTEQNENGKDIIKDFNCGLNENNIVFRDKLFIPIEENKAVNIPVIIGENIRIFTLENETINVLNKQKDD